MKSEQEIIEALKSSTIELEEREKHVPDEYDDYDARCYVEDVARIEAEIRSYEWVLEQ